MSLGELSPLTIAVWQHGLRARGAGPFEVAERVEEATGWIVDPRSVSEACRELVRDGYAARSPFGYRALAAKQGKLGVER